MFRAFSFRCPFLFLSSFISLPFFSLFPCYFSMGFPFLKVLEAQSAMSWGLGTYTRRHRLHMIPQNVTIVYRIDQSGLGSL